MASSKKENADVAMIGSAVEFYSSDLIWTGRGSPC